MNTNSLGLLLVDDDRMFIEGIRRALHDSPITVHSAYSAREAHAKLLTEEVSIVISDLRMPGTDGLHFLEEVKNLYPASLRVLLTGHLCLSVAKEVVNRAGAQLILEKPIRAPELIRHLHEALQPGGSSSSSSLERLERAHPGITEVMRDESGAILIEE